MTTFTGGMGQNAALGNTTDIIVLGQNTETARVGSENSYKIEGKCLDISISTAKVRVTVANLLFFLSILVLQQED